MIPTLAGDAVTDLSDATQLRSVLCALTPGPAAIEAVRQAAALAAGGRLTLVDVSGPDDESDADIATARRIGADHGLLVRVHDVRAAHATPTLLLLAASHDLLVVGADPADPGGGALVRAAVQQSPVPVLIVRPRPDGAPVAERILVASDGSPEARAALSLGHAIATRRGAAVAVVSPAEGNGGGAGLVLHDPWAATNLDLGVDRAAGIPGAIARAAHACDATLVVVGSRGLSGIAALVSVSARVAADVPCSVLVLRPRATTVSGLYRRESGADPDDAGPARP